MRVRFPFVALLIALLPQLTAAQAPHIASLSPPSGPVGTPVTIAGSGFSPLPSHDIVRFGAVRAQVTAASAASITAVVPVGATFEPVTVTAESLTCASPAPFLVTYTSRNVLDAASFAPKSDAAVRDPYNLALCDFDGDGRTDIVVSNQFDSSLSIYRNIGSPGALTGASFAAPAVVKVLDRPVGIAAGDLDGDGRPDIAVTDYNSSSVSVLRNLSSPGTIAFAAHVDFRTPPGAAPFNVVIADLNGDGKPDLAAANDVGGTISVFMNTAVVGEIAPSSFAPSVEFTTGADPFVAAADADGDGLPDLVAANWGSNTVSVLLNTGAGGTITSSSFAAKVDFPTGANPFSVQVGDLDGDGRPDVVTPNESESSASASMLRNTSSPGSVSFAAAVDFPTGFGSRFSAINDLDGDGKPDVAVVNRVSGNLVVLRNESSAGSLTFAAAVPFVTGVRPRFIAAGDLDGDGKPDLAVCDEGTPLGSNFFSLFRNTVRVPPIARLTPASLSFGARRVGTTSPPMGALLENIGGEPLHIDSMTVTSEFGATSTLHPVPDSLAADSSAAIGVTFAPAATGARSGALRVYDDAAGSPHAIPLAGSGVAPQFAVAPAALLFGTVPAGASAHDTLVVANAGSAPLTVSSAASNDPRFTVNPPSAVVAAGSSQPFQVTFLPPSAGAAAGIVVFTHDGLAPGASSPDTVRLSGTGSVAVDVLVLRDHDGIAATGGDRSPMPWALRLYKDTSLVASSAGPALHADLTSGGAYIAAEADSGGSWVRLNRGGALADTFVVAAAAVRDTFVNFKPNSLSASVVRDADGDMLTPGDRTVRPWHLELRRDSAGGPAAASSNGPSLSAAGLGDGTYVVVEADSAGWTHIGSLVDTSALPGPAGPVAIVLSDGASPAVTLVNFQGNAVAAGVVRDDDGRYGTAGDRSAAPWHLELHRGTAAGTLVRSDDSGTLSASGLPDGLYTIVEADSAGWLHLGVTGDAPAAGGMNAVPVTLAAGGSASVVFVNAPPVYSMRFRTFRADSIAFDTDAQGKRGKPVNAVKPDRVEFDAVLTADSAGATGFNVALTIGVNAHLPMSVTPGGASVTFASPTKFSISFPSPLNRGDSVVFHAFGVRGKPQAGSYTLIRPGRAVKRPARVRSTLRFPMPNRVNVLADAFARGAFAAEGGLRAGRDRSRDSARFYGWLLSPKYTDILKTLVDRSGIADGPPGGIDAYSSNGRAIHGRQKTLPPSKSDNVLVADLIALKAAIAASELGSTPNGLGELEFDDTASNPWNGKTLREIAAAADSLVMGRYAGSVHVFEPPLVYARLDSVIRRINTAFEGAMDTAAFGGVPLVVRGTRTLAEAGIFRANPAAVPARITPRPPLPPASAALSQNFPNPFNPATAIPFTLAAPSIVTLKVYNLLGQEVASLKDHEAMEEGDQEVRFDAAGLASGVYFCRLIAERDGSTFRATRKMILLR